MNKYDENISIKLNRLKKRAKCQSSNTRHKLPPQISFQFKSSLFTEKNRTLIEKLVSQSVSPDNSFSKEEIKEKDKEKEKESNIKNEKNKTIKSSPDKKNKNIASTNNSRRCNQRIFQEINNNKKKVFCKKILKNKMNSTVSYMNSGLHSPNNSIANCQIKPIKKRIYNIKINNNNNIEKKKIVFNGIGNNNSSEKRKINFNGISNNKGKNNSVKSKIYQNLNCSTKCLYQRKKLNDSVKNANIIHKRNSVNNKNNLNIITVNTINLKNRINNYNNLKLVKNKNKPKIMVNKNLRNSIY